MIIGISAMSNIILNLVLIPKYGMVGAAITTVISQVIILILCYRRIIDFLEHLEWISYFTQAAIGCIGMSLVLWFLPTVHPGVLIVLGSISYLSIMILTGALNRQDWHHMIHLFNPNKLSS
jgi:O-antigen/teichoic acid export membrane protein